MKEKFKDDIKKKDEKKYQHEKRLKDKHKKNQHDNWLKDKHKKNQHDNGLKKRNVKKIIKHLTADLRKYLNCTDCICGILITILFAWVFFDFSYFSLITIFYLIFYIFEKIEKEKQKELWNMDLAFKDSLMFFEQGLYAGYSAETSINGTIDELENLYGNNHRITKEYILIRKKLSAGENLENALKDFGERTDVRDIKSFAECFSIIKRYGGNMREAIKNTASLIQERIEVQREFQVLLTSKRLELAILEILPVFMIAYLKCFASGLVDRYYESANGQIFMAFVFIFYTGTCILSRRMIDRCLKYSYVS